MRRRRQTTHRRLEADARGVSEVLGVVMLLAMVITIMGGVWVFLNPYLSDFEDNTNWNSATGIADRIEDRLQVAGNAPDGTGFRNTLAIQSTSILSIQNVETWTVAADLTPNERINVRHVNESVIGILSANETARSVSIEHPNGEFTATMEAAHEEILIQHDAFSSHWMVITVYDEVGEPLHRSVMQTASTALSACRIWTSSSKSKAPRARSSCPSCQVAEYHIPPLKLSQARDPSTGMSSAEVESPGMPRSLSALVCAANSVICADMSYRSTEPSISSMTGIMDTIIKPIMDKTPPNNKTVATAAETASSSRRMAPFIHSPQSVGDRLRGRVAVLDD